MLTILTKKKKTMLTISKVYLLANIVQKFCKPCRFFQNSYESSWRVIWFYIGFFCYESTLPYLNLKTGRKHYMHETMDYSSLMIIFRIYMPIFISQDVQIHLYHPHNFLCLKNQFNVIFLKNQFSAKSSKFALGSLLH